MAITIASLAAKLSLDTKAFVAGFASASKASKGFAGSFSAGISSFAASITTAVAGAVSLGSALYAVSQSMQQIGRQSDLAVQLGITVQQVRNLSLAASLSGTNIEVLAKGMQTMNRTVGSGGMPLDKRLFQIADALSQISDVGERNRRATEIFGKGGTELLVALQKGSDGFRKSAGYVEKFNLGISNIDASKVTAANDEWEVMSAVLSAVTDKVAVELSPTVQKFAADTIYGLGRMSNAIQGHTEDWGLLGASISAAYDTWKLFNPLRALDQVAKATQNTPELAKIPAKFQKELDALKRGVAPFGSPSAAMESVRRMAPSGSAIRGSMEAARLIQKAGGDPISMLPPLLQEAVRLLKKIDGNTDEDRKVGRGTGKLVIAEF